MGKTLINICMLAFFTLTAATGGELIAREQKKAALTVAFNRGGDLTLVPIPAGSFQMGSKGGDEDEQPVHTVTLDSFEMSTTEITQGQYEEIMAENPSSFKGEKILPVERVTWYKAAEFCNKLSIREGLKPCYDDSSWKCDFSKNGFRLPTEAEWEYACRAGTVSTYNTGDTERDLARAGWYGYDEGNSGEKSHPVARKEPNAWGLYDMHGNILEWTNDWFGGYSEEPQHNPAGPDGGTYCALRGGSWFSRASYCTSTFRINDRPGRTSYFTGFRVVRHSR